MKAIVAVDVNWGIGYRGHLLERIPADMKFFKETTIGKVVIMGRETFATLPGKEPLKERINIVLSRNENFSNDKVIIRRSLTELFGELKNYPEDDIFVIGGQSVYAQLLPYCTQAYVTKIENAYQADRYFVNLDEDKRWVLSVKGETKSYHSIQYSHNIYINTKLSIFQL